jgi:hypothetical protein
MPDFPPNIKVRRFLQWFLDNLAHPKLLQRRNKVDQLLPASRVFMTGKNHGHAIVAIAYGLFIMPYSGYHREHVIVGECLL